MNKERIEDIVRTLLDARKSLISCSQLSAVKNAWASINDAIDKINTPYPWEHVEVVKQPIDLLTDEELVAEIKKRLSYPRGPAMG